MKVNYKLWIIVFLIITSISYLFIINNKLSWLYNYDWGYGGDVVSSEFSLIKFLVFIIINIIISYLISYVISNIKNKKEVKR